MEKITKVSNGVKLSKVYNPKNVEGKTYKLWLKSGFFNPDNLPGKRKKVFTILLPPPNITGSLHMGHALNATIQDILIRKKRMEGLKTLWLPGTDHAGIATQNVVEKQLKKEGKTRFDLGKKELIERIWQWKEKYGDIILEQLKKLGVSCDWSRTCFTMDKNYKRAVKEVFLHYYKKGWIYQGERVVNWCPRCETSLSDLELEYKEEKGKLYYIKYPVKTQNSKPKAQNIIVATTRPETMLGDTAVAVNPKDKRYEKFFKKKTSIILPLMKREIPIIKDWLVDPKFGTGAVKVTPAHDLRDYQIALKHKLPLISVIDNRGKMKKNVPLSYRGLSVLEAREKIVRDLKKEGKIVKIKDYNHRIPVCYRCKTKIEFLPSKQWFLKMEKLAKVAKDAVKKGKVKFYPKRFEKTYFDWLDNIRDWCISRQIWWGHKIPLKGETDVLDTWFSSALWPFATLGWPKKTKDLKEFYPSDVLSTARDIINLWVARMIFSGIEFMGEVPFKKVFVHPIVLTKTGQRMSKSLGTGIDPMNLIKEYGADATRFGLAWQITELQDIKFGEDNIVMGKKFCNKIWNATRFVMLQTAKLKVKNEKLKITIENSKLTSADKKILKALDKTIKSVSKDIEDFQFGRAARTLYNFFWHEFCDKYIEVSKSQILNPKTQNQTRKILLYVLVTSLKLLHPFMPFITEEIYQKLPIENKKTVLMIERWPQ
ncbi:valine--tRNA ligase [bacterium]|nr:valine--tRNA ligase [bacterium]